ncbi:MAG: RNA polymerase sigma factor [Polyangia bacterium]|jgi:RNA polymerase sigma-70 factor (ECF subfamily)|nr:RNA polymerase sigma factor [Polyangia bacterium]
MTLAQPIAPGLSGELELVQACQVGDPVALGRLYQLYAGRVYRVVCRMLGPQDAEEGVQEVFIKIFRGISGFRGESGVGTWIYRLAVNASLSMLSRRRRRRERLGLDAPLEDVPWEGPVSGGALDRISLERALGLLPPGYRAVLILHDVEGLSHDEIGEVMGWHRGTSKSQLHKARARMRQLLTGGEVRE